MYSSKSLAYLVRFGRSAETAVRQLPIQSQYSSSIIITRCYMSTPNPQAPPGTWAPKPKPVVVRPKDIVIPLERVQFSFCRSQGAGGQNMNKLNTKAEIRFHVSSADWMIAGR